MSRPWVSALRLRYRWQELAPDPVAGGTGWILYDAARRAYRLHNDFHDGRALDYLLHEDSGRSWVSELRDGSRHCSLHPTDRQVSLDRHPAEGRLLGEADLNGVPVRVVEWQEPGHDRWVWYLDEEDCPRRFLTWTHHGDILVDHWLRDLQTGLEFGEADFMPDPGWGCPQD